MGNVMSDNASFRGISQLFGVDLGVLMSFDVQMDVNTEEFSLWFNNQAADANCETCDGAVEAFCSGSPWLNLTIDRQTHQVSVWLEQETNSVAVTAAAVDLPQDAVWATIAIQVEPKAICSGFGGDSGSLTGDTSN
jgi:hypothetical protein